MTLCLKLIVLICSTVVVKSSKVDDFKRAAQTAFENTLKTLVFAEPRCVAPLREYAKKSDDVVFSMDQLRSQFAAATPEKLFEVCRLSNVNVRRMRIGIGEVVARGAAFLNHRPSTTSRKTATQLLSTHPIFQTKWEIFQLLRTTYADSSAMRQRIAVVLSTLFSMATQPQVLRQLDERDKQLLHLNDIKADDPEMIAKLLEDNILAMVAAQGVKSNEVATTDYEDAGSDMNWLKTNQLAWGNGESLFGLCSPLPIVITISENQCSQKGSFNLFQQLAASVFSQTFHCSTPNSFPLFGGYIDRNRATADVLLKYVGNMSNAALVHQYGHLNACQPIGISTVRQTFLSSLLDFVSNGGSPVYILADVFLEKRVRDDNDPGLVTAFRMLAMEARRKHCPVHVILYGRGETLQVAANGQYSLEYLSHFTDGLFVVVDSAEHAGDTAAALNGLFPSVYLAHYQHLTPAHPFGRFAAPNLEACLLASVCFASAKFSYVSDSMAGSSTVHRFLTRVQFSASGGECVVRIFCSQSHAAPVPIFFSSSSQISLDSNAGNEKTIDVGSSSGPEPEKCFFNAKLSPCVAKTSTGSFSKEVICVKAEANSGNSSICTAYGFSNVANQDNFEMKKTKTREVGVNHYTVPLKTDAEVSVRGRTGNGYVIERVCDGLRRSDSNSAHLVVCDGVAVRSACWFDANGRGPVVAYGCSTFASLSPLDDSYIRPNVSFTYVSDKCPLTSACLSRNATVRVEMKANWQVKWLADPVANRSHAVSVRHPFVSLPCCLKSVTLWITTEHGFTVRLLIPINPHWPSLMTPAGQPWWLVVLIILLILHVLIIICCLCMLLCRAFYKKRRARQSSFKAYPMLTSEPVNYTALQYFTDNKMFAGNKSPTTASLSSAPPRVEYVV